MLLSHEWEDRMELLLVWVFLLGLGLGLAIAAWATRPSKTELLWMDLGQRRTAWEANQEDEEY